MRSNKGKPALGQMQGLGRLGKRSVAGRRLEDAQLPE